MTARWLLDRPETPSIWDDEFDSDVIDSKWTLLGPNAYSSVNYIDPYSTVTVGDEVQSLNRQRRSWWMFQPIGTGGNNRGIVQTVSLPSECFIYLRGCINTRRSAAFDNDGEIALRLSTSDGTSHVLCMMDSFGSVSGALFARQTPALGYFNISLMRNWLGKAYPLEYLGIQKINDTYHGWIAPCSGHWVWMGTFTHSVALTDLRINVGNSQTTAPGNLVVGIDFIRVISGRKLP